MCWQTQASWGRVMHKLVRREFVKKRFIVKHKLVTEIKSFTYYIFFVGKDKLVTKIILILLGYRVLEHV
jgi:hypothetical protein